MSLTIKMCIGISSILIFLTYILNKKSYDFEKLSQYECGIEPFDENTTHIKGGETREKFYLKFYIIGIIFLIFDLESILLYPIVFSPSFTLYPKSLQGLHEKFLQIDGHTDLFVYNYISYIVFIIFMILLVLGLIYEYKKKVLN